MPFQNKAQMRACFAKQERDRKRGKKSRWNCKKWLKMTPKRNLRK